MDLEAVDDFPPPHRPLVPGSKDESSSRFKFIVERGASTQKSAAEKRIVRSHVMQEIGRAKRHPGLRPAHKPTVRFLLEMPGPLQTNSCREAPVAFQDKNAVVACSVGVPQQASKTPKIGSDIAALVTGESSSGVHRNQEERRRQEQRRHSQGSPICKLGGGRRNLFFQFPIEMNVRKHELLDHVFSDELCKGSWLEAWRTTSSDPAVLYQLLYWSTLHLRWLRNPDEKHESRETAVYYAHSISIINGRVQNTEEATSDITVRLIIMLLFYNYCIGSVSGWNIHLKGLKEVIRLRGGLISLNTNLALRYLLTRVDVGGSCLQDVPPCFPLPDGLSCLEDLKIDARYSSGSREWSLLFKADAQIRCLFEHIGRVTALIRAHAAFPVQQQRLSPSTLNHQYISPLLHILLSSQNDLDVHDPASAHYEACRLGGILYLAEIRRVLGVFPVWSTVQLWKLEAILCRTCVSWEDFMLPKLWIVTLGATEATTDEERRFFRHQLKRTMEDMGLRNHDDLDTALRSFLFLDSVHGAKLKALYASWLNGI